ncbi:transcriptional regulator with XRE-family HTH domain [Bradyrhizobium sp. USDA 4524]|uniref:helix-turn-helix domain-containing protein n=1 Tax=unclassified Bradyrhizobium TaxID=2631580 RepID=UPI0020A0C36D|nr:MULTISPECIES: helix-turn-helix transcriptional regulator [unclassified Bradyrhizobium]MCP1845590.1 transcriptional regulator with XRE-family HTH domain [Bradyrhizobium sp. USDA 4538]MCP1907087.1 transcriptional regulator with XRE-family HTH domain [Bradyrhizobium sp. USDA 4537]MCP1985562.1 transcriptional regulator with XRE-family HTH domain [Bradyrhizobium sp. USDA 4539]
MKARALMALNVRRIRVERGISQQKLAHEAGIDRSYLASLERQSKNPTIDILDRIADALGVHPFELVVQHSKRAKAPNTLHEGRKRAPLKPPRRVKPPRTG